MTTGEGVELALSWLATYGLHSTLFLGAAWLVCRFRPPRLDRNRERLWRLGLLGGFLSATLQLALGAHAPFGHIELDARNSVARATAPAADLPAAGATRPLSRPVPERPAGSPPQPRAARKDLRGATGNGPALAAETTASHSTLALGTTRPSALETSDGVSRGAATPAHAPARVSGARAPSPAPELARSAGDPTPTSPASLRPRLGTSSRTWSERWPGLVLALWSGLGLLGLLGLLASWSGLRRRMLGREPVRGGALFERFERLRARAKLGRRVRLSVSARIAAPFSSGLLRPEVCLPRAALSALTPAQQEALLAHELAHLARRDPAWFGLGYLIERVFFFQPLNRLARRQLAELAETACDDWAVRWTGARLALASCLTEVADWVLAEKPRLLAPPGLAGQRSRLGQRVERLLDDRRSPSGEPPAPWWPPLALGALGLVALVGPGVSAAEADSSWLRPAPLPPSPLHSARVSARAAPTSAPAAPPVERAPRPAFELAAQRDALADELGALETELAALHAELQARALEERFQTALASIDARMEALRRRQQRASELLALLTEPARPTEADAEPLRDAAPSPRTAPAPNPPSVPDEPTAGDPR